MICGSFINVAIERWADNDFILQIVFIPLSNKWAFKSLLQKHKYFTCSVELVV